MNFWRKSFGESPSLRSIDYEGRKIAIRMPSIGGF